MIGEAVANTALAITDINSKWAAVPPVNAALIALTVASGAAQVAAISKNMQASGESISGGGQFTPGTTEQRNASVAFESAARAVPEPSVVLVTEDLSAVQSRVAVTESRASIG